MSPTAYSGYFQIVNIWGILDLNDHFPAAIQYTAGEKSESELMKSLVVKLLTVMADTVIVRSPYLTLDAPEAILVMA